MPYNTPGEVLTAIGNSIRTLYGSTSSIPYVEMPGLIKDAISGEGVDLSDYNGSNWILAFIDHVNFNNPSMFYFFSNVDYETTTPAHSLNMKNIYFGGGGGRALQKAFYRARLADVNLSGWDFRESTIAFDSTFHEAHIQSLDLSNWNLTSGTIFGMFQKCNIGSLDLTGWDTSEITSMSAMFYYAKIAKMWVPSSFVASAVTDNEDKPFYDVGVYGNIVIYTDATDAETQGWGTIGSGILIHYNSTYQDFINA